MSRPEPDERLELERDNLRTELAAARLVIASGYGTCSSCKHWTENAEQVDSRRRWPDLFGVPHGDCDELDGFVFADGYEVDDSGIQTPPDFGCVLHVKATVQPQLPPLEIGEAKPSSLIVTEHPFPIVYSNHVPGAAAEGEQ